MNAATPVAEGTVKTRMKDPVERRPGNTKGHACVALLTELTPARYAVAFSFLPYF